MVKILGGSRSVTDQHCERRKEDEECGVQPPKHLKKLSVEIGKKCDQKVQREHDACSATFAKQCNRNSSSTKHFAAAAARRITRS